DFVVSLTFDFFVWVGRAPRSPLFPYTTLFRSHRLGRGTADWPRCAASSVLLLIVNLWPQLSARRFCVFPRKKPRNVPCVLWTKMRSQQFSLNRIARSARANVITSCARSFTTPERVSRRP